MRSFFIIFILLLLSFEQTYSQDIDYAKSVIKSLCSEEFGGRAYDFGGDKLSADFIIKQLKQNNVKPLVKDYTQEFNIQFNSLYGKNTVFINSIRLKPGSEYIISSGSPSISGRFPVLTLNKYIIDDSILFRNFIKKDFSNTVLLVDTAEIVRKDFLQAYQLIAEKNYLKAKAVIKIENNNLLYVPSPIQNDFTCITISRNVYSEKIKNIELTIESKFINNYQTQNVLAYLKGQSDTSIILSAHYDHIGQMGFDTYFPGANDNASGVAMLLNLTKAFSKQQKLKYNIVFMFFSGEEIGLLGSKYYTENPVFPLSKIKFLINLDMVGTGDEGIKIVNGSVFKKEFDRLSTINTQKKYLPDVKIRGAAANSDHYFFYANNVKSFFIYTLGQYKEYHSIYDTAENVPLNEFEDLTHLLIDFINSF